MTNIDQPTFTGTADPLSLVQVYAQRADPTQTLRLGQAIVGSDGAWSLTSIPLHDGFYTITATETTAGGFPSPPVELMPSGGAIDPGPLVIDTEAPRVSSLTFDPHQGVLTVVFQDGLAGLDPASLANPANYVFTPLRSRAGVHPSRLAGSPATSGFYTDAQAESMQITLQSPLPKGHYLFQVTSGGVRDLTGNPLDGEFHGAFPSGDGRPGGNFIAQLIVPRPLAARLPVSKPHRPHHPHHR